MFELLATSCVYRRVEIFEQTNLLCGRIEDKNLIVEVKTILL